MSGYVTLADLEWLFETFENNESCLDNDRGFGPNHFEDSQATISRARDIIETVKSTLFPSPIGPLGAWENSHGAQGSSYG